jgi:hypothetical protein
MNCLDLLCLGNTRGRREARPQGRLVAGARWPAVGNARGGARAIGEAGGWMQGVGWRAYFGTGLLRCPLSLFRCAMDRTVCRACDA